MQTIFSIDNLEADNFFQPITACEQFFYEKSNPPPPDKKVMVRPLLGCSGKLGEVLKQQ